MAADPALHRKWNRRWLRETAAFVVPWFIAWFFVSETAALGVVLVYVGFSLGCVVTYSRALADQKATMALLYGPNWEHNATIGHMREMSHLN